MNLISERLEISGMTCVNCQNKIERKLRDTDGIEEVNVSYNQGCADITYDSDVISREEIVAVIEALDYGVISEQTDKQPDIGRIVCILIIIISLYAVLQHFGVLNMLAPSRLADTTMGYGMLFVIGLITSVHCIAMCGGINLTQCLPKQNNTAENCGRSHTFRPAFLYNLGRVISYTVIGFFLGFVGMLPGGSMNAELSTLLQGILKLIAGVFMVIMGINMLGIFPWLRRLQLRIPKFAAAKIGEKKAKSKQPLIVGLLNGLMPCGPLQSMQLVALAAANPFTGALSMLLFSLGTVPLMLGLGSVVSALGKRFTQKVMNVGAVLVVVLGLAMLSQGGSLSGLLLPDSLLVLVIALGVLGVVASIPFRKTLYKALSVAAVIAVTAAGSFAYAQITSENTRSYELSASDSTEITDGVQAVSSTLYPGSYPDITVRAGMPVKWAIDAPAGSINGCNYKMIIPEYGIEYTFSEGENIIEFTPTKAGSYGFTCWMGMIHGNIYVTE